jgi:hypothetical protein
LKTRTLLILGLIIVGLALASLRAGRSIFGQTAPNRIYPSPVGDITLPTVDGTAGTVGTNYQVATLEFGVPTNVPQVGTLAGDTGNGFSDRYDFENLNAFSLTQSASEIGDRDSLNPANEILVGGRIINPGFRFVHIGLQPFVWRIGGLTDAMTTADVTIFPSIDHLFDPEIPGYGPGQPNPPAGGIGNALLEATEFTVYGTNNRAEADLASRTPNYFGVGGSGTLPGNGLWVRGTLIQVVADGFKDFNGVTPFATTLAAINRNMPFRGLTQLRENDGFQATIEQQQQQASLQEGDDFATRWQFLDATNQQVPVKYVAVYANRTRDQKFYIPDSQGRIPGDLARSLDAEIDAVGYVPFGVTPTPTPTPEPTPTPVPTPTPEPTPTPVPTPTPEPTPTPVPTPTPEPTPTPVPTPTPTPMPTPPPRPSPRPRPSPKPSPSTSPSPKPSPSTSPSPKPSPSTSPSPKPSPSPSPTPCPSPTPKRHRVFRQAGRVISQATEKERALEVQKIFDDLRGATDSSRRQSRV